MGKPNRTRGPSRIGGCAQAGVRCLARDVARSGLDRPAPLDRALGAGDPAGRLHESACAAPEDARGVRELAIRQARTRRDTASSPGYLPVRPPPGPMTMQRTEKRRRTDVAVPLAHFALAGLVTVIIVGAIGVALQRNAARDDAIRHARTLAEMAGNGILAPNVNQALVDGDPAQVAKVDRLVHDKILSHDGIVRV